MWKKGTVLRKVILVMVALAVSVAAIPVGDVYAAGAYNEGTPGDGISDQGLRSAFLEWTWARERARYERQGRFFERADVMVEKVQARIDRLAEKGFDISSLQEALDEFKASLDAARAAYAEGETIIATHAGFDDEGKVTDIAQASQTVRDLAAILRETRQALGSPMRTLREAVQAFREANRPPAAPADGSTQP